MTNPANTERKNEAIRNYYKNPNYCLNCKKLIQLGKEEKPNWTRRKKFCNSSCAANYNNEHRKFDPKNDDRIKHVDCKICGNVTAVNVRAPSHEIVCLDCKEEIKKSKKLNRICPRCGQTPCISPNICKKFQVFPSLVKYFGLDINIIGTKQIAEEFIRIRDIITEELNNENNNIFHLMEKYGHHNVGNFYKILCSLGVIDNSTSRSNKKLHKNKNGKSLLCRYHTGWHETQEGKKVFYRSSYELEYAKELDILRISYDMEKLRIPYYDTQLNIERVAIPDFYIPLKNLIVEIKSSYTYDHQNMKDKSVEYINNNYNFKLFVDGLETKI